MIGGAFVKGPCAYCGLDTIDFCSECGAFVCRRCDTRRHWPAVGIVPDIGFVGIYPGGQTEARRSTDSTGPAEPPQLGHNSVLLPWQFISGRNEADALPKNGRRIEVDADRLSAGPLGLRD